MTSYYRPLSYPAFSLDPSVHARPAFCLPGTNPFQGSRSSENQSDRRIKLIPRYMRRRRDDRARRLAAVIPPEILDLIVGYVADCVGMKPWGLKFALIRRRNSNNITDSYQPLRSCSLVCCRWANLCRSKMFMDAILNIGSAEDCEEFVAYATHGCPSLVPIYKLISSIRLNQLQHADSDACSFGHTLWRLPKDGLERISLELIVVCLPSGFSTPHWSIPPTVVTPYSLMSYYDLAYVEDVHMSSFPRMMTFVRHFIYTGIRTYSRHPSGRKLRTLPQKEAIHFAKLTWDNNQRDYPPPFRVPTRFGHPYRPFTAASYHSSILVVECTNNTSLCMHIAIARSTCCMHWLPDYERRWIFSLMTSLEVPGVVNGACEWCRSSANLIGESLLRSNAIYGEFILSFVVV